MAEKTLLPLFPLDLVLVPWEVVPLHVFEPRYRSMISRAFEDQSEFGVVRQTDDGLESVGCAAKVREIKERREDGRFNADAMGTRRFEIRSLDSSEECVQAGVEFFGDDDPAQASAFTVQRLLDAATKVLDNVNATAENWNPNHPWLSFRIAGDLPLSASAKQALLETRSEVKRTQMLTQYLHAVIANRGRREEWQRLGRSNGKLRD